jgi:2,4-dienoyl-CoA reductase-like NADH-dependent reductase (Old Yellow Enzyme family)
LATYFKYKSVEDLETEVLQIGLPIGLRSDFQPLAEPTFVANRRVGNRIAVQPMEGCDGRPDGTPDELTYRRYQRFGAGGAKLIWGEATAVSLDGQANPRQLHLCEENLAEFAKLLDSTRRAHRQSIGDDSDLLIGLQLTHSGRFCFRKPILAAHCAVLDKRTFADRTAGTTLEPPYPLISDDELERLADAYVKTTKLVFRAGFDFVDLKQCHRYLLGELLAAKTRPGGYGGEFEKRSRFILRLVQRIRTEVPTALIASRMNAFDGIPFRKRADGVGEPCLFQPPFLTAFGTNENDPLSDDLDEPIRLIGLMRDAGVSLVNISLGCPYYNPHILRPAQYPPIDGYDPPEHPLVGVARHFRITAAIQAMYPDLAIVGSGYSFLQDFLFHAAAANVADGRATFCGIGRIALAYPSSPRDILEHGRLNRKSVCRTFSYCTNLMRSKHHPLGQFPTGCPPFDKEVYHEIWKEASGSADRKNCP